MAMPVASGLTMIDPDEPDYPGGPIETPEGRRSPVDEPAPLVRMAPVGRGPRPSRSRGPRRSTAATRRAPEAPAAEPPAKRSRPRRRPKAEAPVAEAVPQPE